MPQPIAVGSVLGGRYRITQHVVTSADQDRVFLGTDQVLNRHVRILVASPEHAAQVASSARELATGERTDEVQVLDLGLSEGRTYLIAGGTPDPDVLLGLAYEQQLHVEPFQTDTLGSELFGENRQGEAHEYEDDEAYYSELDEQLEADAAQTHRLPGFLNRISERLNERVRPADGTAAKAAAGASALAAAEAATRAQEEERARAEQEAAERAEQDRLDEEARRAAEARQAEEDRAAAERAEKERARAEQEAAERAEQERVAAEKAAAERAEKERREAEKATAERAEHERLAAEQERLEAERAEVERAEQARRAEESRRAAEQEEIERRRAAAAAAPTAAQPAVAPASQDAAAAPTAAQAPEEPRPSFPRLGEPAAPRTRPAPRRALDASEENPFKPLNAVAPAAHAAAPRVKAEPPAGPASAASDPAAVAEDAPGAAPAAVESRGRGSRAAGTGRRGGWLGPLLLTLGLLAVLVAGALLLGNNLRSVPEQEASPSPAASSAAGSPKASGKTSASSASPTAQTSAPRIAEITRDVPDMPTLEAENDGTLAALTDGDATTPWRSFAYSRPNFGGYVESMNLIAKLERPGQVNAVVLNQQGNTGGDFIAYLADSPDGENARQIGEGTFDEPETVIPVEAGGPDAQYVIISLTSLPKLEGAASDRPYGLRLTEISVR